MYLSFNGAPNMGFSLNGALTLGLLLNGAPTLGMSLNGAPTMCMLLQTAQPTRGGAVTAVWQAAVQIVLTHPVTRNANHR